MFDLHAPTLLTVWVQLALHKMHFLFLKRHCHIFLERAEDCWDSSVVCLSSPSSLVGAGRQLLVSQYCR